MKDQSMKDLSGRLYATVAETKVGSKLEADGGFTCIKEGSVLTVEKDHWGRLYVPCGSGEHYLGGQVSSDGAHYIGFYHVG